MLLKSTVRNVMLLLMIIPHHKWHQQYIQPTHANFIEKKNIFQFFLNRQYTECCAVFLKSSVIFLEKKIMRKQIVEEISFKKESNFFLA